MKSLTPLAIKRLTKEFNDIKNNPLDYFSITYDTEDLSVWYIKIYNLDGPYTGGEYILKLDFPENYPFRAPNFVMLTPNGKFEINCELCFSNSSYHQDEWSSLWNLNSLIVGFISMFNDNRTSGVGHINRLEHEKIALASISMDYNEKSLKKIMELFI